MRIQILPLPHVVLGEVVTEPFALIVDQYDGHEPGEDHAEAWKGFRDSCGASAILVTPDTVEVVDRYAEPAKAEASGEPAEIASLPPEVVTLIHAVDRMRDQWVEADVHARYELWMAVHDASDAVYRAYRESPPTTHLTAGWPRLQQDRSEPATPASAHELHRQADRETGKLAWLHQCGHLNPGYWHGRSVCGGCRFSVEHARDVTEHYRLVLVDVLTGDDGAQPEVTP